ELRGDGGGRLLLRLGEGEGGEAQVAVRGIRGLDLGLDVSGGDTQGPGEGLGERGAIAAIDRSAHGPRGYYPRRGAFHPPLLWGRRRSVVQGTAGPRLLGRTTEATVSS